MVFPIIRKTASPRKQNSENPSPTSKKGIAPQRSYLIQYHQSWQLYFVPRKWIARLKAAGLKDLRLKSPLCSIVLFALSKSSQRLLRCEFYDIPTLAKSTIWPKIIGEPGKRQSRSSIHTNVCAYLLMFLKLGARYAPKMCPDGIYAGNA